MKLQTRITIVIPALAMALASTPANAQYLPELDNEFVTIPSYPAPVAGYTFAGWNNFEITVAGNQAATVVYQDPHDPSTDPFEANGESASAILAKYYPANNTTAFSFFGNPITTGETWPVSYPGAAHFGLTGPKDSTPLDILQKFWSGLEVNNANPGVFYYVFSSVPAVNVALTPPMALPAAGSVEYETIFTEYEQDGLLGGSWDEIPETGSGPLPVTFNSGNADPSDPITFLTAEYMITSTEIPLDDLNSEDLSPTGPGWTPMALPPPITSSVPDGSSTLALLGFGAVSLLVLDYKYKRYTRLAI